MEFPVTSKSVSFRSATFPNVLLNLFILKPINQNLNFIKHLRIFINTYKTQQTWMMETTMGMSKLKIEFIYLFTSIHEMNFQCRSRRLCR